MSLKLARLLWAVLLGVAGLPQPAAGQPIDQVGNRAAAIGAFVAVADDATAVVWNPAGLVNGPIFNILLDLDRTDRSPAVLAGGGAASRSNATLLAASVMPLGISYLRARQTFLESGPAVATTSGRQDRQVSVRSLVTSQLGVTVVQSIADSVTVGATLKLMRGSVVGGVFSTTSWDDAFERAETLEGSGRTTADVDVGVLAGSGRLRAGIVARNLAAPTFEADGARGVSMKVDRQVRVGVAWGDKWPTSMPRWIAAVDADVTRVRHFDGDRRDIAAGVERWFKNQRFALRGGIRGSTLDAVRPIASGGASLAVRQGVYVDVFGARGEDIRRWGIAGRLTY